jgi:hypothetical protein
MVASSCVELGAESERTVTPAPKSAVVDDEKPLPATATTAPVWPRATEPG